MSSFLSGRTSLTTVQTADIAAGAITTAKIAANNIDSTLTKDALIADYTEVTIATGDSLLLGDVGDSGNTKRDTVQGLLDLAGGGKILQVRSTFLTTATFTNATNSATVITGLTVAITPASSSNTILLLGFVSGSHGGANTVIMFNFGRGGSAIGIGVAGGSRDLVYAADANIDAGVMSAIHMSYVDSPSSTSELTYSIMNNAHTGTTVTINRSSTDTDNTNHQRAASSIIAMEIDGT
jgi:hypothetical protein